MQLVLIDSLSSSNMMLWQSSQVKSSQAGFDSRETVNGNAMLIL
jgi:hypothetical protein